MEGGAHEKNPRLYKKTMGGGIFCKKNKFYLSPIFLGPGFFLDAHDLYFCKKKYIASFSRRGIFFSREQLEEKAQQNKNRPRV